MSKGFSQAKKSNRRYVPRFFAFFTRSTTVVLGWTFAYELLTKRPDTALLAIRFVAVLRIQSPIL